MKNQDQRAQACTDVLSSTRSCTFKYIIDAGGKLFRRDTIHFDHGERCHDCGILNKKGNIHHWRCDVEQCPKCGRQLFSCGCWGKEVRIAQRLGEAGILVEPGS